VQWYELWLLLKNAETPVVFSPPIKVNFLTTSGVPFPELNLTTDVITTSWTTGFATTISRTLSISYKITPSSSSVIYRVNVFIDNVLNNTFDTLTGIQTITVYNNGIQNDPFNHQIYITIQSNSLFIIISKYSIILNLQNNILILFYL
jgi:hypothetical protein